MSTYRSFIPILALFILSFAFSATAADSPKFTKTVLPNGLTVIVKPEESAGIVAIEVFIKAGAAEERESNAGIGNLIAHTLLASTRNKRAEKVAAIADEVGGNLQTEWNPDYTEIKTITTTPEFDDAVILLGDILNNANFEQKWVDRARQEMLTEMAAEDDDIFDATCEQIRQRLYSDNPYHRPASGYVRTLQSLTPDDLQKFYNQYYVPNNIVIAVVGDVKTDHAVKMFSMAFAGISSKTLPKQRPIPEESLAESKSDLLERPIGAAYILFGFLAPSIKSPDYPAARVAAVALGSGKGSRMFQNIREKQGLAYELGTVYPMMKEQSHILVYLVTDPYKLTYPGLTIEMTLEDVKKAVLAEINKMQNEPLTNEELERAKRYTIGTYALSHQRIRERAFHLGWTEAIGLGCEYDSEYSSDIEAVTAADVQRIAKKYLNNYAMTIVLPEAIEK
ncbi:MAG: pitrilysin family protein [Armatimonadota bacterium]